MSVIDKTPLKSKKFIFALWATIVLAGLGIAALLTQTFVWAMAAFMCIIAFGIASLAIAYVNGQASQDKFTNGLKYIGGLKDVITPKDDLE
jgi:hypothetical protein